MHKKLYALFILLLGANLQAYSPIANKYAELMYACEYAELHDSETKEQTTSWLSLWSEEEIPEYEGLTQRDLYDRYQKDVTNNKKEHPCTYGQMLAKAKKKACNEKDPEVAVAFEKMSSEERRTFLERYASWKSVGGVAAVGALAGLAVLSEYTHVPLHCLVDGLTLAEESKSYESCSIFSILFWPFKSDT